MHSSDHSGDTISTFLSRVQEIGDTAQCMIGTFQYVTAPTVPLTVLGEKENVRKEEKNGLEALKESVLL